MIKIKLSSVGKGNDTELEIVSGESLDVAVKRSLAGIVGENQVKPHFIALVNGHIVPEEMWENVKLKTGDHVLIAPKISGGDSGNIFKTIAVIAVTVIVSYYAGPEYGQVVAGLLAGAASIGTSLLLNALIPPPVPEGLDIGSGGDLSGSQMYSISSQANTTKKFSTVSKMYGAFRVYPAIAANPYTELEADPANGSLIQFFYCVYDFGLGPMQIDQIKIGDTPITDFSDVDYNLVDINKPATSEGTWDDATQNSFTYYKGSVERESVSVALNKDNLPINSPDDYEAIRNASANTTDVDQEIILTFVAPLGMYVFNSTGVRGTRSVDFDIFFSKVGEDIWHGFNDPAFTKIHSSVGGSDFYQKNPVDVFPPGVDDGGIYPQIGQAVASNQYIWQGNSLVTQFADYRYYGLLKGATTIILLADSSLVGQYLRIYGQMIGKITSITSYIPNPTYNVFTFDTPLPNDIKFFTYYRFDPGGPFLDDNKIQIQIQKSGTSPSGIVTYEHLVIGRARISGNDTNPVYSTFKFTPLATESYKIRVTRVNTFSDNAGYTNQPQDNITWAAISTRFNKSPIATTLRHTFLEIRIRATNQLNGAIQNLSGVCVSAIDVYDPGPETWSKQLSSNPAWILADLLTGEVNKRAIDKSRLDVDSLVEWADFCDEVPTSPPSRTFILPRFTSNLVIDYSPTLQTIINQITSACQASLNITDGKYGVLIDKLKTVPVQIFTPRNSRNFSSQRNYTVKPHALKISYVDPSADWEVREMIAYDSGYSEINATEFDEATSFACTNSEQAWRLGRYMLAQNRLRQETITLEVDFENLVCTRGDFVQICHDVMKVGGTPARVKFVSGSTITTDDAFDTTADPYGFVFRGADGIIYTNTLTVLTSNTFALDGPDIPEVGDLIVIGLVGQVVIDCLVKSISPNDNLSATITLVEKADPIYSAESTDTVPDYDPQIADTASTEFKPPGEVENLAVADSYFECNNANGLDYYVSLDWDSPSGAATDVYEVWVDSGKGYNLIDETKQSNYLYKALVANLGIEHKFKILAVSATGKKLDIGSVGEVTQLISRKSTPPSDVEALYIDITGEVLQLFWPQISECSIREYLIRYSPTTDATWERSIPLLRVSKETTLAATQARTGTYLIKAVDVEGNQSNLAAAAITTIPQLFNLNVIEETTDFPALPGAKDRVTLDTGALILKNTVVGGVDTSEYYPEGFYYYENFLDLGEIYTVRLQSLIEAEGFSLEDLMSNWPDLASLDSMSHAGTSEWDVETQYRTTDTFNVMSDWTSLDVIDPISEGSQDNWTAYKKFTIGDATGRIFQFRLRLVSNKVSVTPRVFDGTIRSDMPDRFDSFDNLSAPSGGLAVAYDPAFKGPGTTPNIQISIDAAASGDYWSFDYKTLDGFYIRFFDKTNAPVARQFDAAIKGFGRKATAVI